MSAIEAGLGGFMRKPRTLIRDDKAKNGPRESHGLYQVYMI
jgi:hypothetical protein